jgi:hypothetical protein
MIEDGAETAEIQRATREGRDQDIVLGTVATIANCVFVPSSGQGGVQASSAGGGLDSQVITTAILYAPPGAPVPRASDKIRVRGQVWHCDGDAALWRGLDGAFEGYEQRLKRVVG